MQILVFLLILLRVTMHHVFPAFKTGITADLIFSAIAVSSLCVYSLLRPSHNDEYKRIKLPIAFLVAVMIAQIFICQDKVSASFYALYQSIGIMMFSHIATYKKNVEQLKNLMLAVFVLVSIKAITELFQVYRPSSFFGWPTATASVLIIGIPVAFTERRRITLAILTAGLLATKSIMPILSLAVVICFVMRNTAVWFLLLSASTVAVLRGDLAASINVRIIYLKTVIAAIGKHWFIGSGPSTFFYQGSAHTAYAHNSYLQIWSELGIVAFISVSSFVYRFLKTKTQSGMFIGLAAFLFDNLTNFTLLRPASALMFWVMLGVYINENSNTAPVTVSGSAA